MKSVTEYPFSIASGGTYTLPAMGDYFRIQSSTGSISVTVEGSGTLPNLLSGQGIKNTPFRRLVLVNTSGALNTGTILVASEEFIDNRTFGVNDLSAGTINTLRQPLTATGFYGSLSALAANTSDQVFSPASNINGAILLYAQASQNDGVNSGMLAFVSKASAPATVIDGQVIAMGGNVASGVAGLNLQTPQYIAPGLGLYFISSYATSVNLTTGRSARFRLL